MRVCINYCDGLYWLYDPTLSSFADDVDPAAWLAENTIEITDDLWKEYQDYMAVVQTWQERIAILDQREPE